MEIGAEVNIRCRSPQVGAEVIPCRSYSCRTSIAPVWLIPKKSSQGVTSGQVPPNSVRICSHCSPCSTVRTVRMGKQRTRIFAVRWTLPLCIFSKRIDGLLDPVRYPRSSHNKWARSGDSDLGWVYDSCYESTLDKSFSLNFHKEYTDHNWIQLSRCQSENENTSIQKISFY